MKRLVLVRHAESRWNAERRVQGQRCAGLSEFGHAQAEVAAAALAATFPHAQIVTSDLQRTRETASYLETALGTQARQDARLRERNFGEWEGWTPDEVATKDHDRWVRWTDGADVIGEVGGESREELTSRVVPVFAELLESTPDDAITIAITHGGPIWHGTHGILDLMPGTFGGLANTSVTELVCAAERAVPATPPPVVLDRWNDIGHLPVELRSGWHPRIVASKPPVVGP